MVAEVLAFVSLLAAAPQEQPVPQPFPRPGTPIQTPGTRSGQPPARPEAPAATADTVPTEATLGIPVYPNAQFIASYDAGRGQRFYLFGTSASFVEIVTYYRTLLRQRGDLVYEVPATHQFDVGRFDDDVMAFPPGVTVKDYQSEVSQGYPNPKPGGQPARFPTIIQIVPAPAAGK